MRSRSTRSSINSNKCDNIKINGNNGIVKTTKRTKKLDKTESAVVQDEQKNLRKSKLAENKPKSVEKRSKTGLKVVNSTKNGLKTNNTSVKRRWKKERKRYICAVCNKEFLGSSDLRKHLRIHSDERPFECEQCHSKFRQAVCLKNHIASIHGTDQKFICDHCNKSFPIKERLRLHMRVHSGEKPYSCPMCTKKFARGGQLRQHLVIHNGEKKYKCEQCPSSFSSPANLKLHVKTHSEEREFMCHICNKSFYRSDALRQHLTRFHANIKAFHCNICNKTLKGHLPQHIRLHDNIRPFICSICSATFSQKSQLNVHQRMHSGERPYRCPVCWQAFAHSSVLKLHIRKHTGEKPFKCLICKESGTAFSQLPHLKTHMRTIHGKDKPYMCEACQEFFKTKAELSTHGEKCSATSRVATQTESGNQKNKEDESEAATVSKLRLLLAIVLKKISTEERLKQLGFEKRLIDNVILSALKLAGRVHTVDENLSEKERLHENISSFLDWTVPESFMEKYKQENRTIVNILEELANAYTDSCSE